jgi:hypothetical protein
MKSIYILTAFLCLYFSAYSQTNKVADGNYVFGKAVVTAYNYDTKAEVFTHTFNDVASLDELKDLPYPVQPVFLSAFIQNGVMTLCTLWNNNKEYSVQEEGHLLVPAKPVEGENGNFDPFSQPYYLSPLYKLELEGDTATFTFTEPYGSGAYSFPLEGKFVITLTREETK